MSRLTLRNITVKITAVASDSQDVMGGEVVTENVRASAQPCGMRSLTGTERERLGREGIIVTHRFKMAADAPVVETSILEPSTGGTFDVKHIDNPHRRNRQLVVDAIERR